MRKIVYILFFTIGLNFTSLAQNKTVSAEAVSAKLIKFYPNPASAVITFEFSKAGESAHSLQVYNFMGKKVYDIKNAPSRVTINLEDFFRGIYIFQVRDKNGTILQSGKFQVVK
ncbi:MAG: T9SS type A sorting domain-containing protein [Gloeobacteraceae cyanobacterium ES-bin-316]|nr:T9SS type A sorting domain-containing protein [Ferruginibacter sp.]